MKFDRLILVWWFANGYFAALAKKVSYNGYKVFRLTPKTMEQIKFIQKLEQINGTMFWRGPYSKIGVGSDIMLSPDATKEVFEAIQDSGIQKQEYVDDVQSLIDAEEILSVTTEKSVRLNWNQYGDLDTIYQFMKEQSTLHDTSVTLISIGKTFEGRDLKVLKVCNGSIPKPAIWIESNIHAREWISGAVATFMINEILNGQNPEIASWKNDFDFYFLVIANPDGYVYSHSVDRLWRKTRSTTASAACPGADANRNFGFQWRTGGSSTNPCDETYAGSQPFSEPETQAISEYYSSVATGLVGFVSLHSYGQLILLPYGVQGIDFPGHREHMYLASKIQRAIGRRFGTRFQAGSIVDILYPASGGSIDWVTAVHNTTLTYVFELRDNGRFGFLLPAQQIIPASQEFLDGFQPIVAQLRRVAKTSPNRKLAVKMNSPLLPRPLDVQTFGALPSKVYPIIPGFRRF